MNAYQRLRLSGLRKSAERVSTGGGLYRLSPEEFTKHAKALGHTLTTSGIDMSDKGTCSCGWQSEWYFDGLEYIATDWRTHVVTTSGNGQAVLELG